MLHLHEKEKQNFVARGKRSKMFFNCSQCPLTEKIKKLWFMGLVAGYVTFLDSIFEELCSRRFSFEEIREWSVDKPVMKILSDVTCASSPHTQTEKHFFGKTIEKQTEQRQKKNKNDSFEKQKNFLIYFSSLRDLPFGDDAWKLWSDGASLGYVMISFPFFFPPRSVSRIHIEVITVGDWICPPHPLQTLIRLKLAKWKIKIRSWSSPDTEFSIALESLQSSRAITGNNYCPGRMVQRWIGEVQLKSSKYSLDRTVNRKM